jgi:nucleoid-associated protein YgaU
MRSKIIAGWRKAVLATATAGVLAGGAQAQQPPADPAPTADAPAAAAPNERGQLQAPAGPPGETQEYTIQKGDTLWDLSQKFLANPWYWPKIWSLNPSIENPHWIYPGNKLKVQAGGGGAPAQVDPATNASNDGKIQMPGPDGQPPAAAEDPNDDPLAPSAPPAGPDMTIKTTSAEQAAANAVVSKSGRLSFKPPSVLLVRSSGLVTEQEVADAGTLEASFEEKQMLAQYDTAYVKFKQEGVARVGDKLIIFRPDGSITNPNTKQRLAMKTKTIGEVKVVAVNGSQVTVQVGRTWEEIERGDLVRPWSEQMRRLAPRPNSKSVDGVVIGAKDDALTTMGEGQEVFIDKGKNDGVEDGNTFYVVRKGDGLSLVSRNVSGGSDSAGEQGDKAAKVAVPDENVAMLLVIEARDTVSSAMVIHSVREIEAGERVEMRPGGSGGF